MPVPRMGLTPRQIAQAPADAAAEVHDVRDVRGAHAGRKTPDGFGDLVFHVPKRVLAGACAGAPHGPVDRADATALSVGDERGGVAVVVATNLCGIESRGYHSAAPADSSLEYTSPRPPLRGRRLERGGSHPSAQRPHRPAAFGPGPVAGSLNARTNQSRKASIPGAGWSGSGNAPPLNPQSRKGCSSAGSPLIACTGTARLALSPVISGAAW